MSKLYIRPDRDNRMRNKNATTNYGTEDLVQVGNCGGKCGCDAALRGLYSFVLPNGAAWPCAPANNTSVLNLWFRAHTGADTPNTPVDFNRVLRAWTETGSTWNNWKSGSAWTSGGANSSGFDICGTKWWRWTWTTAFTSNQWLTSCTCCCGACKLKDELNHAIDSDGRFDFRMRYPCDVITCACDTVVDFAAKENTTSGQPRRARPKLALDYTDGGNSTATKTLTGTAKITAVATGQRRRGAVV